MAPKPDRRCLSEDRNGGVRCRLGAGHAGEHRWWISYGTPERSSWPNDADAKVQTLAPGAGRGAGLVLEAVGCLGCPFFCVVMDRCGHPATKDPKGFGRHVTGLGLEPPAWCGLRSGPVLVQIRGHGIPQHRAAH